MGTRRELSRMAGLLRGAGLRPSPETGWLYVRLCPSGDRVVPTARVTECLLSAVLSVCARRRKGGPVAAAPLDSVRHVRDRGGAVHARPVGVAAAGVGGRALHAPTLPTPGATPQRSTSTRGRVCACPRAR